jgi:hypothetical protein
LFKTIVHDLRGAIARKLRKLAADDLAAQAAARAGESPEGAA